MLEELKNKHVTIHYSPVEGFASPSKGIIIDLTEKWLKLEVQGKKHAKFIEYIQIDRILKVLMSDPK
ncbi:MAG: hypothetical protein HN995_01665 [Candidatus Marinimicrobia bacterium]|mgnify:CR=1 FL=1|jgi:hypothetical protein|nr:hypothetical protein [Candidatus Neomarinimicrobiota bacterium]MBT3575058.1 hypothetical protein [Candidatus Neomarinimicrobiota bacterium]MBT3678830.1 hypothetical protein [Candidatus Neomarinimicrobiota bacterium]MBT3949944.1 hypothetical protein [Candidatus Neomarinimicrobiota bacterium]MBT4252647.1 hypothetical protein [Candidatus Neomarinimicrobiota bacterium]